MKLLLVLLTYLLCTHALNLNLLANFDVIAEAAGSITAGILAEDLNIGTGAILNGVTAAISSDLTVQGTLTLGSTGILASTPTLNVAAGVTLNVDVLAATSAIINLAEGAVLIVNGTATVASDSAISVAAGAMVVFEETVEIAADASVDVAAGADIAFRQAITGAGSVIVSGRAAFNASLSAAYSAAVDVKSTGIMYIGAGIREFTGIVMCAGDALIEAGAMVVFEESVEIAADASFDVAAGADIAFRQAITGAGSVIVSGRAAFNASLSAAYSAAVDVKSTGIMYIGAGIREFTGIVMCAGDALIETGAFVEFTADTTVSSAGTLVIEAEAQADFSSSISGTGKIIVDGSLVFSESAETNCEADIEARANSTVQIGGTAMKTFTGVFNAALAVGVSVEDEAEVQFEGKTTIKTLTLGADSQVIATGETTISDAISLGTAAFLRFEGKGVINAGILGSGLIEFAGEGESEVNTISVESDISISASANVRFGAEGETSADGDIFVSEEASLYIASDSALKVSGDCSFEADTTYNIVLETAESVSILTVSGEAMLNGTVSIETDITFEADVEIPFIKYSSRVDASTFAQVNVVSASGKRALMQGEDFEVEYQEDQAVIKGVSGVTDDDDDDDNTSALLAFASLSLAAILV